MSLTNVSPPVTLEELIQEISRFEAIIADWDESQQSVVAGLKRAIENLHKEALVRLIRSVKQEAIATLLHAVEDEVVYGVLRYHELVKPPTPPLEVRLQSALDEVRPGLKSHNGDVELVAIQPPDTVEIRLLGTCSNCPASTVTLSQGVEQAIKAHCPEITNIVLVSHPPTTHPSEASLTSPFANHQEPPWVEVTTVDQIPLSGVLAMEVKGTGVILSRTHSQVNCFHNTCNHMGMPLDMGTVNRGILTCLFHGFQYSLDTGECLTSPEVPLQSYPVQVEDNRVFAQLGT